MMDRELLLSIEHDLLHPDAAQTFEPSTEAFLQRELGTTEVGAALFRELLLTLANAGSERAFYHGSVVPTQRAATRARGRLPPLQRAVHETLQALGPDAKPQDVVWHMARTGRYPSATVSNIGRAMKALRRKPVSDRNP